MSAIRRGLATRMKEVSLLGVYIHCYSHRLNLALQRTLGDIEPLCYYIVASTTCEVLLNLFNVIY